MSHVVEAAADGGGEAVVGVQAVLDAVASGVVGAHSVVLCDTDGVTVAVGRGGRQQQQGGEMGASILDGSVGQLSAVFSVVSREFSKVGLGECACASTVFSPPRSPAAINIARGGAVPSSTSTSTSSSGAAAAPQSTAAETHNSSSTSGGGGGGGGDERGAGGIPSGSGVVVQSVVVGGSMVVTLTGHDAATANVGHMEVVARALREPLAALAKEISHTT